MKVPIKWIKEYIDLPDDLKVFTDKMSMIGHLLDKIEKTDTDTVVDLELRGNRADCYGVLGLAREYHAAAGGRFDIPHINMLPQIEYEVIKVTVDTSMVKRFYSCVIKGLVIKPSPDWMQERLKNYGIEPINNLIDITNYVMIETAKPMHAFDLDKLDDKELVIKQAEDGDTIETFDGSQLKLTKEDTIYADKNGTPLGVSGIIGGKNSGISAEKHNSTTNILLECAAYDRVAIRRSMFRHNIQTDAGLRHSHELHPSLCDYALARAVDLYMQFAADDNTEINGIADYYPNPDSQKVINFDPKETRRLGGIEIPVKEQSEILNRLEFATEETIDENNHENDSLIVSVPLFRTDILESADLVEEVLRIFGYENIPSKTLSSVIPDPVTQKELIIEEKSRDLLTALGLNEVITVPI